MGSCMNVTRKREIEIGCSKKSSDDEFYDNFPVGKHCSIYPSKRLENIYLIHKLQDMKISNNLKLEIEKSSLYRRRCSTTASIMIS
ncbi:hypothetical protein SteCoe_4359 [Stentor coeruleus]|uniref:Uncharacterized protein n=1 Tax=Stentor coeruleus TaxID=5963 RepID=A0A1R2CUX7_9CILI|nr:hypothetical protein SteCoe_4359 [Stentor coeruleus]